MSRKVFNSIEGIKVLVLKVVFMVKRYESHDAFHSVARPGHITRTHHLLLFKLDVRYTQSTNRPVTLRIEMKFDAICKSNYFSIVAVLYRYIDRY